MSFAAADRQKWKRDFGETEASALGGMRRNSLGRAILRGDVSSEFQYSFAMVRDSGRQINSETPAKVCIARETEQVVFARTWHSQPTSTIAWPAARPGQMSAQDQTRTVRVEPSSRAQMQQLLPPSAMTSKYKVDQYSETETTRSLAHFERSIVLCRGAIDILAWAIKTRTFP